MQSAGVPGGDIPFGTSFLGQMGCDDFLISRAKLLSGSSHCSK
jgi:hypothetical protein